MTNSNSGRTQPGDSVVPVSAKAPTTAPAPLTTDLDLTVRLERLERANERMRETLRGYERQLGIEPDSGDKTIGSEIARQLIEIAQLRGLLHGIATCSHFQACDLCRDLIAPYKRSRS